MRASVALICSVFLFPSLTGAQAPRAVVGSRAVFSAQVLCTDLPVTTAPAQKVVIRAGHNPDGHVTLGAGESVVLSGGTPDGLSAGQRYLVRRLVPGTGKSQSNDAEAYDSVRTAGWLTVTAADDHSALAKIDFTCDAIEPGDYLETFAEPALPERIADMAEPRFADGARVLFGTDRRVSLGDGDLFSVDRGREQGVVLGDRMAIYRDRHNGTPLVHVADAVVMELSEKTSKAVLVMVKDAVSSGDLAFLRR